MRKSYLSNVAFKFLLSAFILFLGFIQANGQYTIDNTQPASATNFQSFNAAYNAIKTGIAAPVVFNVVAGTGPYNEQLIIKTIPGATATNRVVFNCNGVTMGTAATATGQRAIIKLDGASFIVIDSLTIDAGLGTYGYGVQLIRDADSNVISRCTINTSLSATNTSNYAGIVMNGTDQGTIAAGATLCDFNIFYKNKIFGGNYGITNVGSTTGTNGNNQYIHNFITDFYQYGIYLSGTYNTLIDSNVISRPNRTNLGAFTGIYLSSTAYSDTITRNTIKQPFDGAPTNNGNFTGINYDNADVASDRPNYVINNIISAANGLGSAVGLLNSGSDYVQYYHNTVSIENVTSTTTGTSRGFALSGATNSVTFYDNILSIYRGGTGQKHCIYFNGTSPSFICDYNDLFNAGNGSNNYIGYKGTNYATLQAWKATTFDANSKNVDPVYVDPSTGNYKPQNAAFDNKGLYLGIDFDIYQLPRNLPPLSPDMGAVEFVPPPCTAPPTAGTTLFNYNTQGDTTVCENTIMPLGLQGNSFGSTQIFQWQTSASSTGPFVSLGNPLTVPDSFINASTTYYIRCAVTCGTSTVFSNAIKLNVNAALPPGTYTIDTTQNTTYIPGIAGGNFKSFARVKEALGCGVRGGGAIIINVLNGPASAPYSEQFVLGTINNMSPTNTITFNGNGQVLAYSSSVTTEKAVIKLNGTKFITFDSLVIDSRGTGGNGFGVHLLNNADSNTFRRCTILSDTGSNSTSYAGVVVNSSASSASATGASLCDGNVFDKNTVIGGYYGMIALGSTTSVINNNQFTNNNVKDFYNYGIFLGSGNFNTLVEGNRITRPTRFSTAGNVYGIYLRGTGSAATVVSKNRVYNLLGGNISSSSSSYGISHDDADGGTGNPHTVSNNLVFKFSGTGPAYGISNIGSTNIEYYYNTIAIENMGTFPTAACRGFNQSGTSTGSIFKNNMVTISRDGTGAKHVIYLSNINDVESNFNNLYINSTGGTQNYIGFGGGNRLDLTTWQITTQDANSLSYDPGYANPSIEDYRPVVSPLDNKATPLSGITTDILNVSRSATPDMGAFEFTVPPCGAPSVTTATVTPNTGICVDVPIVLDLPGGLSATGLTYVWQNSPDGLGNWTNISDTLYFPKFNTLSRPDRFYRLQIICSGTVNFSTVVSINMNLLLVGGSYTINKNLPTNYTGTANANFNSYADAITAMNCGITGPVVFNVSADTYTEQVFIHRVPGLGTVNAFGRNTATFQSANAATSVLTFSPTLATANFTLKIDSAKYVGFHNITIANTSATFGRAVEISGTSGYDTLLNCIITTTPTTNASNTFAAVYSLGVNNLYIKGNTVTNGSSGIYLTGSSSLSTTNVIVDGNTVSGGFNYGIYTGFSKRIKVTNNNVSVSSPISATAFGVYTTDCDTAYRIIGNTVNITNVTSGAATGIYSNRDSSSLSDSGIIASNKIIAGAGNTGNIFGLVNNISSGNYTVNNVIAITTAGTKTYGLHSLNTDEVAYYNNSVSVTAPTSTTSYAAYFDHSAASVGVRIRNNIFANKSGTAGKAIFINNATNFTSNYNNLFTTGGALVQVGSPAANFTTLGPLIAAYNWETNSIVFPPAFVSDVDLRPNLTNPDVWAIHGRGVQIKENNYDFNNNPRPVTLAAGVPDLGAYEFHPTVDPTVLLAIPSATPTPGATQIFMYGTDTVMKIKWDSFGVVPPSIAVKRFSGDAPPFLPTSFDSMYFYTKVEIPGGGTYKYSIQQFYIEPWLGTIPDQRRLGLGKTLTSNSWVVGFGSSLDFNKKIISQTLNDNLDKFTGLINPYAPVTGPDSDSSNTGKRFWCAYPINELGGGQTMLLYLSATEAANVQVKINGTNWVRNYFVPANTVRVSDIIPQPQAWIDTWGLSDRGISITSDVPIVAYTHIYGSASSGAGMLMPVGVWGYEYQTLGIKQQWGGDAWAYYYVIADNDNTKVEITSVPGEPLQNTGMTPGVPYAVTLNKGEFYQVVAQSDVGDLTGSVVKSVANTAGVCYPVAVFSGSSRTQINCPTGGGSGGDFIMQQVFPYQAWGKRFLTAPTSSSDQANALQPNIYRISVRSGNTIVKKNGVVLTGIINNNYYQYFSATADYIEADKPIMIAQFLTGACAGVGDPEMIYISPIEQGIKKVGFYRNTVQNISTNYLTMVVPTNALPSIKMYEGINPPVTYPGGFSYNYPHPQNNQPWLHGVNYTVLVKRWTSAQQQVRVESDSAFTGITYGLTSVESYGYNAGTLIKNLRSTLLPTPDSAVSNTGYTCARTPFRIAIYLPVVPEWFKLQFSAVPSTPNTDVFVSSPIPNDTIVSPQGDTYYKYDLPGYYTFPAPNVYGIPLTYKDSSVESCDQTRPDVLYIQVLPEPKPTFSVTSPICEGDTTFFKADSLTENGIRIKTLRWNFHDNTSIVNVYNPYKIYPAGSYRDTLKIRTDDGCLADTVRDVIVTVRPSVDVIADTVIACYDSSATFVVLNPIPGATYNWYDSANGVIPIATNDTFVVNNVIGPRNYWVEVIYGCAGLIRKQVTALVLPGLPKPVPVVSVGVSDMTWTWTAIAGATGYQVSVVGSGVWTDPSSGPTGLSHTITGLAPQQSVCLIVRVLGATVCLNNESDPVCGQVGCPVVSVQATPVDTTVCPGSSVTFTAISPTGYTFTWYDSPIGGALLNTGDTYTITANASDTFYIEGNLGGCSTTSRLAVKVSVLAQLLSPMLTLIDSTQTTLTFNWSVVAGATAYEVSLDNGITWLNVGNVQSYLVSSLNPGQSVTLYVRAITSNPCQNSNPLIMNGTTRVCSPLATPAVRVLDSTYNTVTFTWPAVAGATTYTVTYNTNQVYSGPLTTYTVTGLSIGQTVSISVVASGSTICPQSNPGSGTGSTKSCATLTTPIVTVLDSSQTTITFVWGAVSGAVGYLVNGTISVSGTTYTITGLNPGQTVSITVVAVAATPCPNSSAGLGTGSTKGCVALPAPLTVSFVDSSSNFAIFSWSAVSGAKGYKVEVLIGNQTTWTVAATNQQATSISIPGLNPTDSVRIRVTTLGGLACENSLTATIGRGKAALDQVYIPNAFTPNGSGSPENERLRVYSNILKEGKFMIFNQWGQKIFEANTLADMKSGWDGTHKGKQQPVGVYIYVGRFTLTNGSVVDKKGSINLVR